MVKSACIGMPRAGGNGEMCDTIRDFTKSGFKNKQILETLGSAIRKTNLQIQIDARIDYIPCNDFTNYDHVLDTTVLLGNIPRRYYWEGGIIPPEIYFAMIEGQQKEKFDVQGMPSHAWFNTSYSYVVPELSDPIGFAYSDNKPISHFLEAKKLFNIETIPTMLGPVSYLMLSQNNTNNNTPISDIASSLLPVYSDLFQNFIRLNIQHVRFEEPFLVKDLTREEQLLYRECYKVLHNITKGKISIHIITSYGSLGNNLECAMSLEASSIHYDFVSGKDSIEEILDALPEHTSLSMGLVNANDGWVNNISESIDFASRVVNKIGSDRVIIAPSTSLFTCPLDANIEEEQDLDKKYKRCLSFAKRKLQEVTLITKGLNQGKKAIKSELSRNKEDIAILTKLSEEINSKLEKSVKAKTRRYKRAPFKERKAIQSKHLKKSILLPITDVGSLPSSISSHSTTDINQNLKTQIADLIKVQERHLDIVNAGEIERRTNIEYFAELIDGIDITKKNVTQISGNQYIHKPIIHNISNKVSDHYLKIAEYCQSITANPIRFSIIGPISLVNMSFIPTGVNITTCYKHFAHLIGEQITKLQEQGIKYITISEPALLQNIPLRSESVLNYIKQISEIFKISTSYALDDTQISLHLQGLPFEEYIEGLGTFDVDLLLLEAARSKLQVLEAFVSYKYPNDIAIGVFNADSRRLPTKAEIRLAIHKSLRVLDESQLWITTDVGMKHRTRKEAVTILETISNATKEARKNL